MSFSEEPKKSTSSVAPKSHEKMAAAIKLLEGHTAPCKSGPQRGPARNGADCRSLQAARVRSVAIACSGSGKTRKTSRKRLFCASCAISRDGTRPANLNHGWLTIAANRCRTQLARRNSHSQTLSLVGSPEDDRWRRESAATQLHEELQLALVELPASHRSSFHAFPP